MSATDFFIVMSRTLQLFAEIFLGEIGTSCSMHNGISNLDVYFPNVEHALSTYSGVDKLWFLN
jgi:hypothetical protein